MTEELQKKVNQAVKLLQSASKGAKGQPIEICYSGGKDSDVILELAKMAEIPFRAIYRNTTIDPPGTISHVKEMGVEILRPKKDFFTLIKGNSFPTMRARFCCKFLKEYKVLDFNVQGVRKAESAKRNARYSDVTECRFYNNGRDYVQAFYPILEWSNEDVKDFITERGIKCAPVYYDENGAFHVERRLGCLACPLKSKQKDDFKQYPKLLRAWVRAGKEWWDNHPNANSHNKFRSVYELLVNDLFFDSYESFELSVGGGYFWQPYRLQEVFGRLF